MQSLPLLPELWETYILPDIFNEEQDVQNLSMCCKALYAEFQPRTPGYRFRRLRQYTLDVTRNEDDSYRDSINTTWQSLCRMIDRSLLYAWEPHVRLHLPENTIMDIPYYNTTGPTALLPHVNNIYLIRDIYFGDSINVMTTVYLGSEFFSIKWTNGGQYSRMRRTGYSNSKIEHFRSFLKNVKNNECSDYLIW